MRSKANERMIDPPSLEAASVEAVVFDLGGVLIDWNPRYLYRKLFPGDPDAMEAFLSEVCTPAWNEQQDAGRPWADAIAEAISRHPAQAELIAAYRDRWSETLGEALPDSVAVLNELRKTEVRLYALTNWSHETFPVAIERYAFLGWFESIVVSGREKLIKPDPAIFRLIAKRHQLEPARTVFIDDSVRNVEAADALGFQAIRFLDAKQLRTDLRARGVPVRPAATGAA